ncbi:MAG: [FeFe] hydrogenase H-cluster radical SAM maturase HydE [Deltaproteobacteria bacterium]|nr:[FeFe] hydrogenase H-cluster radical SAM maturase HydE [Deltaproteobacteria bacterium]
MNKDQILEWLKIDDQEKLEKLWRQSDEIRRVNVGEEIHLRGLVEVSNFCARDCGYCGIRVGNQNVCRYRMSADEIMDCVRMAVNFEYGSVVLQAGEDYGITRDWLCDIITRIKRTTNLAITLSLGERGEGDLAAWRQAGADRYLLRFETSNRELYDRIHPPLPGKVSDRFEILRRLREIGYEVGSGIMVGIPGQSYDDLANDILLFKEYDIDMIGIGPYIPHPGTPLGMSVDQHLIPSGEQVPGTELMTCKVVALTRILCPLINIPSTTALATINRAEGRAHGLSRGANIVMPNLTPKKYRELYEIYPAKASCNENADESNSRIKHGIIAMGRAIGVGRGDSANKRTRTA